ncbi:MAG: dicarboxylate/amino acid:cation symporter [Deltaproteobacteria bacterium]|nr:dicarboxylate/amino acid:cation symporter [Deltaproteobacteria bacterium]
MKQIFLTYCRIPLVTRLLLAFVLGTLLGLLSWSLNFVPPETSRLFLTTWVRPFGDIFIHMLKMVVIPIVFFSLIQGASQMPVAGLGRVGLRLLLLYISTSFLAAIVGVGFALLLNPGAGISGAQWMNMVDAEQAKSLTSSGKAAASQSLSDVLMGVFQNPFSALASSEFLAVIVFAIMAGLAMSLLREEAREGSACLRGLHILNDLTEAANKILYKLVSWIMEYAPIGVCALSLVNFGLYGPAIVGPYLKVVTGIILGIFFMMFVIYALLLRLIAGKSPLHFFMSIKEAMMTAFVTRSSSAALPISLDAAVNRLHISKDVASFALPMGATINMDGVCVHLPMFAILASNLFQLHLGPSELFVLIFSTVLAAVGTGGIPGGSLMLLFIVLGTMGLSDQNIAIVVSLALGVNPILDMFETMNNVTGDLICTYLVSQNENRVS